MIFFMKFKISLVIGDSEKTAVDSEVKEDVRVLDSMKVCRSCDSPNLLESTFETNKVFLEVPINDQDWL